MFRGDPLANPEPLIKRVYAYIAYRVGDGPDAEDLTSETFERALRYRKSYDSRKGEPIAWLIGIARRCVEGDLRRSSTATSTSTLRPQRLRGRRASPNCPLQRRRRARGA